MKVIFLTTGHLLKDPETADAWSDTEPVPSNTEGALEHLDE